MAFEKSVADVLFMRGEYEKAANAYLKSRMPVYDRLENCYKELGDFQKAYEYACLNR